jgi:hypothetical protein
MNTAVKISPETSTIDQGKSISIAEKFNKWCVEAEPMRIVFLAGFLLFQGCVIVPAIVLIASFYDIGYTGFSVTVSAFGTVAILVSNISEAPIKVVVYIFLINLLISLFLIGIHVVPFL